jgi:DNA-binding NarL/FixJ family response regulator
MEGPDRRGKTTRPRILLVDDHEVLRKGIRSTLDGQWEICGEAASGLEAIEKAAALKPDLVLMDVSMPEMNGIEATKQVLKVVPGMKVVIFTMHDSPGMVEAAKAAGANACLTKTVPADELRRVIAEVLNYNASK